jgi:transcriptional regulator with XRE-family HTH domain
MNVKIGARIRELRKAQSIAQAELARGIGYAQAQTVGYMESGQKLILAADLAQIANHLGVTVRALFPKGSVR